MPVRAPGLAVHTPNHSEGGTTTAFLVLIAVLLIVTVRMIRGFQSEKASKLVLQIILVDSRSKAEGILRRFKDGEPFEKLAREYSVDPSAPQGGYIGAVKFSDLRSEIRDALKDIGQGRVTPAVETPTGYMIVRIPTEAERVEIESLERNRTLALGAPADYRVAAELSGLSDVDDIFRRLPRPDGWQQDLRGICELRIQAIRGGIQQFEDYLASKAKEPREQNFVALLRTHHVLAQLRAYQGDMGKAIQHLQSAYELAVSHGMKDVELDLEEKLGIAYLRQSEIENSMTNLHVERCGFPISPAARYRLVASSENALKHFLKYLDRDPEDQEVTWLLNLAYMTLGKYPDAVPARYLVPPAPFQSPEDIGRFVNVAPALGLDISNEAGGVIADDFNNDGFLDIVTSSWGACAPMHHFQNNGNGTFTDRTSQSGLSGQLGGLNLLQADYNNDGCLDILVLRGAWQFPMRKSLLKNNCDGTFTDVTHQSGVAVPATRTQTAAWADIDNDGRLDLFVGNEFSPSQLFLNKADGTFVDIALTAGVDLNMFTKAVVAGDYDNDGYPDFYVSNLRGDNFLYHNNGDRTFTDVAGPLGVKQPIVSFPAWFFDYDNDGWLDLFVSSYYQSVTEVLRSYLRLPIKVETQKLYRNTGKGFEDVTEQVGLHRVFMPMGSNFGDVDNDGFLDFYLGTGAPTYAAIVPNALFKNKEGKRFVDVTASSGTGCLHKGHGVAFADIDNDGDQDIFIEVGGAMPGDQHTNLLFQNPGNGNHWIRIELVGVKSNRAAIGARLKLGIAAGDGTRRFIHRVVGSGGSFGASPLEQHIGLGKAAQVDTLEIWWPTSGTRQVFQSISADQFIEIREFGPGWTRGKHRPLRLPKNRAGENLRK